MCGEDPIIQDRCQRQDCPKTDNQLWVESQADEIAKRVKELEEVQMEEKTLYDDSGDRFIEYLDIVAQEDAEGLKRAQQSYGNSWKSRGGVGAFMMLARKWDRLETRVQQGTTIDDIGRFSRSKSGTLQLTTPYDIFAHIAQDLRSEGIIDDIRDLRRYLMLVEAEMRARGFKAGHRDNMPELPSEMSEPPKPIDGQRHPFGYDQEEDG